jgi:hypothetical protein
MQWRIYKIRCALTMLPKNAEMAIISSAFFIILHYGIFCSAILLRAFRKNHLCLKVFRRNIALATHLQSAETGAAVS